MSATKAANLPIYKDIPDDMFADAFDALPDAVLFLDVRGCVRAANEAARKLFGKIQDNVPASGLLPDDSPLRQYLTPHALETGGAVTVYDVTVRHIQAPRVALRPLSGGGYVLSFNLSSEHVRITAADKMRDALTPARFMARTLAHEIKNPLTGIQAAAQILAQGDVGDENRELVDLIGAEAARILRMIRKVDIFGDDAQARFVLVNIHAVLDQCLRFVRATHPDIKVVAQYDPSLPAVFGHFDGLSQVVGNILKNAIEALPPVGGRVTVRTFYNHTPVYHPDSGKKLPLCVVFEDNGAGMDTETLVRVFEPYYTTKTDGEGLGLAVVSKIVDDHGGLVDVDSVAGHTVFRLSFPVPEGEKT